MIFALALCLSAVLLLVTSHRALASDINLHLTKSGDIINSADKTVVGELYHGWREDVVFASLSSKVQRNQQMTLRLTSDLDDLDIINPHLYAIHGAQSTLSQSSRISRTWTVIAAPGSQVTLVAQVPSGSLDRSLLWGSLSSLGHISDDHWFILAILLPSSVLVLLLIRRWLAFPHRRVETRLHPELLSTSPASLTVLFRGFVSHRASAATLVDLARRGHVRMLIRQDKIVLFKRDGQDSLRPHELLLLDRWFNQRWNSTGEDLTQEIRTQLISTQSTAANLAIYREVDQYHWFTPSPLISHWKILLITFFLTILCSALFFTIFIALPSAIPLLWFMGSLLVVIAMLYAWAPSITHPNWNGHSALTMMAATREGLSDKALVQPSQLNHNAWEQWLPVAIVLGVAPQWLRRWKNIPFQQPSWFLTPEPIREFDEFLVHLSPILRIASESIRDTILPAYL